MKTFEERFWEKVDVRDWDDCWLWTAGQHPYGYGVIEYFGVAQYAHRIAYELSYDDVEFGSELYVLHCCDNPPCCNPGHLYQGTHQDNMDDRKARHKWPMRSTGKVRPRAHPTTWHGQQRKARLVYK